MSEYYPTCSHQPCPVCGDTFGSCSINEYRYALLCHAKPQAQEGDLEGAWKCLGQTGKYSQWEEQRVVLERGYREPQVSTTGCNGQPVDFAEIIKEIVRKHIEKQGGES